MKNRNEELKRKLKKAASISLCAVLAGGRSVTKENINVRGLHRKQTGVEKWK